MKRPTILALLAFACAAHINLIAEPIPSNKALLSAPRTIEEFPTLTRGIRNQRDFKPANLNRALVNSPRAREEFPALSRSNGMSRSATGNLATPQNSAWLASPRSLEEWRGFLRGAQLPADSVTSVRTRRIAQAR